MQGAESPAPGHPDCMPSRLGRRPVSARQGPGRRARGSPQECRAFRGADSTRAPATRPTGLGETPEGRLRRGDLPTSGFANIRNLPSPSPSRRSESRGPARAPQALGPTGPAPQKRTRPPGAAHSASALCLGSTSLGWREPSCHSPLSVRLGLREPGVRGSAGGRGEVPQEWDKVWAPPISLEAPPAPRLQRPAATSQSEKGPQAFDSRVWLPSNAAGPWGTSRSRAAALCAGNRALPAGTARWCLRSRGSLQRRELSAPRLRGCS